MRQILAYRIAKKKIIEKSRETLAGRLCILRLYGLSYRKDWAEKLGLEAQRKTAASICTRERNCVKRASLSGKKSSPPSG